MRFKGTGYVVRCQQGLKVKALYLTIELNRINDASKAMKAHGLDHGRKVLCIV